MAVSDRPVLELRVHGVSNTPPQAMLDVSADSISEYGDELGGFWSLKPDAQAALTPKDRGWVPDHVRREAYSWGAFARSSVAVPGFAQKVLGAASRVGWILLMPFGLANVAFWSRLPDAGESRSGTRAGMPTAGHRTMRWFALVLTLLYTMTLFEIFVDIVAVQCMARAKTCSGLPTTIDFVRTWTTGQRAAVGILAALVVVGALIRLSLASTVRYETVRPPETLTGAGAQTASSTHVLSDVNFWSRPKSKRHLLWVHMYAASAVMTLTMAVDWNLRGAFAPDGQHLSTLSSASRVGWVVLSALAVVVLGYVVRYLSTREWSGVVSANGDMTETRSPSLLWRAATGLMLLGLVALLALETPRIVHPQTRSMPGVITPSVMSSPGPVLLTLVCAGLVLAGSAWSLRTAHGWRQALTLGISILVVAVLVAQGIVHGSTPALQTGIAVIVVIAVLHLWADHRSEQARRYAFAGRAAAVFMMVSLGFAVLLGSAATLSVGDWLNGCYSTADLMPSTYSEACKAPAPSDPADLAPTPSASPSAAPSAALATQPGATAGATAADVPAGVDPSTLDTSADLTAPAVYQMAGALILPCVLGALILLSVWAFRNRTTARRIPLFPMAPRVADRPEGTTLLDRRHDTRIRAGLLRRGEGMVAVLAAVVLVNLALAVGLAASAENGNDDRGTRLTWALSTGAVSTTVLTLFVVGLLAASGTSSSRRPLGLIWDLMCFLPRDGHPLSPPCYAERAVPELTSRILAWNGAYDVDDASRDATTAQRRVVLSGHSLGGVLCVAAVMQLRPEDCERVGLITYGSQLQAYFSRIFPVLLGPQVLGVPAVTAFPFWRTEKVPVHLATDWDQDAVRCRLGGRVELATSLLPNHDRGLRWRSLWRASDPLGFPVDSGQMAPGPYATGPIDFGADEVDATGYMPVVQTHSDYPRTDDYHDVLHELVELGAVGAAT